MYVANCILEVSAASDGSFREEFFNQPYSNIIPDFLQLLIHLVHIFKIPILTQVNYGILATLASI